MSVPLEQCRKPILTCSHTKYNANLSLLLVCVAAEVWTTVKMEQFEQLLTCAICLDRYRIPKLLPCQHSFCMEPCMDGLVDYVRRQVSRHSRCQHRHRRWMKYTRTQSPTQNLKIKRRNRIKRREHSRGLISSKPIGLNPHVQTLWKVAADFKSKFYVTTVLIKTWQRRRGDFILPPPLQAICWSSG